MPRLNQFDQIVDKVTNECNTSDDWGLIMDVCDIVKSMPNGPKDCLRAIVRRLNNPDPHIVLLALTLLDACVKNCGRNFHLEVCSRSFEDEIKKLLVKKTHPKVVEKIKFLIQKWVEEHFKNDPQLSLLSSLYNSLKDEGMEFKETCEEALTLNKGITNATADTSVVMSQQEEDDIAKAIELSLKETSSSPKSGSSLYPAALPPSPTSTKKKAGKEPRKVRALYDFEAAEDNELTFKGGEIILVLDDSDSNWWKGSNHRGEGLFPSNFVTADLIVESEIPLKIEKKSVQFSEEVKVKTVEDEQEVEIDEEKIDNVLHLLHEADPTGEQPESEELLSIEEQCMSMGPLIDQELEQIDRKHASLTSLSQQLMEALNFYHSLMKDCVPSSYGQYSAPDVIHSYPQQVYGGPTSQTYLPSDHYQQLPISSSIPDQQYSMTGSTGTMSSIPPPQVQYSASVSGSFSSIPPNSSTNIVYSAAPHTTPVVSPYYDNAGGQPIIPQNNPQLPLNTRQML